jgi:hypothetical protein
MQNVFIANVRKHSGKDIPANMQERLNVPPQSALPKEQKEYYRSILNLVTKRVINLYSIASIVHQDIYASLPEKAQGEVDLAGTNILQLLRYLADLASKGYHETLQMKHLVDHIWQIKEKVEQQYGDVFII